MPERTPSELAAAAAWNRRKRRLLAQGVWVKPLTSPETARAHVTNLARTYGLSLDTIGHLAGMTPGNMEQIMLPGHHQYRQQISRETQERILATRFDLDRIPDEAFLTNVGTVRRVQALLRIGWTLPAIGARLGLTPNAVSDYLGARRTATKARVARRVRDLYDELSMTPGPSAINVRRAVARGWVPPLAWDDETIDDPTAEPDTGGVVPTSKPRNRPVEDTAEDVEDLLGWEPFATVDAVAERLGFGTSSGVQHALTRAGRQDLLDHLSRNARLAGFGVIDRKASA